MQWNLDGLFFPLWVVYKNPLDFPNSYVVRLWDTEHPTEQIAIATTLTDARRTIPPGKYNIGRRLDDEVQIVEVWI